MTQRQAPFPPHPAATPTPMAPPPPAPGRRLGPRPLATHLATCLAVLSGSPAGLPFLSADSPVWKGAALAARARALRRDLDAALNAQPPHPGAADPAPPHPAWVAAVDAEIRRRLERLVSGLERYRRSPPARDVADPPCLWRQGGSRLLDYGTDAGAARRPVLFVPSLINRGYILDLSARKSLLRHLAGRGLRPLLLDWGEVGPQERAHTLEDYVAGRLLAAVRATVDLTGVAPVLVGYCMGGTLAVAAAQMAPDAVRALGLLAAPWDFQAADPEGARRLAAFLDVAAPALDHLGEMPVDMLQLLFAVGDPCLVLDKFSRYADMAADDPAAGDFVALEDWLNDGVPLSAPVARDCLAGWYGANTPARGLWRVAGQAIRPHTLRLPTLAVIPARDRIVPPAAALALADAIPGAQRLCPDLGHIGMVVSAAAPTAVWTPLAHWLAARFE